ncbi:MAG: hypothetical protein WKH64_05140 [Chloroflexia bacterium]
MLQEVKQWFECLPPQVAEMSITSPHENYQSLVHIRPLSPGGAPFTVGVIQDRFDVHAGRFFSATKLLRLMESPLDYCNAVVSGGLSEVVCIESGVIVDWQTELQMQGRKIRRRSSSQSPPARAWDRILGGLRTRRRKHRVGYAPYYELVPNLIEPFGSVAVIPPIFAVSMGDVERYSSVKWAELDTEPWDTLSSPYDLILDSQGRMLRLSSQR